MKTFRIFIGLLVVVSLPIAAQQASTLDELLQNVEQGRTQDALDNQKRENEFRQKRGQQEVLLSESAATKVKEEERSAKLENVFEDNEKELNELTETLNERLGALKELFGVMQQVAGDARSRFDNSLTNVQYPNRGNFLENLAKKLGSSSKLPSIEEIEKLWFELQREMTETGKVVKFTTDVIDTQGSKSQTTVVRVGAFNIVTDGKYLNYEPTTGNVSEIPRQPEGRRYTSSTSELFNSTGGKVVFGVVFIFFLSLCS